MKKMALAWVVGLAIFLMLGTVQAVEIESHYYSGDFLTEEWKEKMEEKCFYGPFGDPSLPGPWANPKKGCPGYPGNTFEIVGQGFEFKDAVVEFGGDVDCPSAYNHGAILTGGTLKLKDKGPWLDDGDLLDEVIDKANYCANLDFDEDGKLANIHFIIFIWGEFDEFDDDQFEKVSYNFFATYNGAPKQKLEKDGSFEELKGFGPLLQTDIKITKVSVE